MLFTTTLIHIYMVVWCMYSLAKEKTAMANCVTGFEKTRLPCTSNFMTSTKHNSMYQQDFLIKMSFLSAVNTLV